MKQHSRTIPFFPLFLITVFSIIFFTEIASNFLFPELNGENELFHALSEASRAIIISAPFMWWLMRKRLRAEGTLRENEARLSEAQRIAHVGNWVWNLQTNELIWSDEIYRIFGMSPGKVEPSLEVFLKTVHPDDLEFVKKSIDDALQRKKPYDIDIHIILPDSSEHIVNAKAEVNFDGSGKPLRMFGTVQDITEQKLAEKALRESEDKYRTLVENLPQKIFIKDRNLSYVSCNENYARDLNIKPAEIAGKKDYDFYPEELAEKYRSDDRRIIESGKTEDIEERYVRSGQESFVHTVKTPIRDEKENVVGVLGIFWDITESKRAELEYKTVLRTAMDGFYIVDAEGRILEVNDSYCHLIGYSRDELLNRSIKDIEAAETEEMIAKRIRRILEVGWDRFETRHRRKDGRIVEIEASVNYMEAGGGKFFVFMRDVTERKRVEKSMHENEARLKVALGPIDMAVFNQDLDLHYTWMYKPQLGYTIEQVIGKTDAELLPLEAARQATVIKCRVLENGIGMRGEVEVALEDRTLYYDLFVQPLRNAAGQVEGITGSSLDITERRHADEALKESEEKYRVMMNDASDAIALADKEGNLLDANKKMEELTGYTKNELLDMTFVHLHPHDELERIVASFQEGVQKGTPGHINDTLILRKDRKTVPIDLTSSVIEYAGKLMQQAIFRDITERKRAEGALHESEARYQNLANLSPVGIFRSDVHGNCVYVNERLCEITGQTPEQMYGLTWAKGLYPDDCDRVLDEWKRAQVENKPFNLEFRFQRPDGITTWLIGQAVSETGSAGEVVGYVGTLTDITQRKQAENALKESEEKYRTLIENIQDGVFIIQDAKIKFANESFARIGGYTVKEVIGMDFRELVAPEDLEMVSNNYSRRQAGDNVPREYEFHILQNNGKRTIVNMNVGIITFNGRVASMGTVRDITERKRVLEALRESEERYRRLVEFSPYGIAIHSDHKLVYANEAAAKIFGAAKTEELIGKSMLQFIHPDYREIVKKRIRMQEKGEIAPLMEEKFLRLDGTAVDVEIISIPFNYKGKVAMYGVFRDITERNLMMRQLQEKNELLKTILESLPHPFYVTDTSNYAITLANSAACRDGLLEGSTCYALTHKRDRPCEGEEERCPLGEVKKTKRPAMVEHVHYNKDGDARNMEVYCYPIFDNERNVVQVIEYSLDITERKKSEEIRHENEHLMLASKAKSEFLANMSHELRTPLNAIIGFSELMKEKIPGELNEKQSSYIEIILGGGEHLLNLINDILDLSKVEAGKIELNIEKVPLPETIDEVVILLKEKAAKQNVLIDKKFDTELRFIEADKQKLKQILFNLLNNAVKFSKPYGGTVTIKAKEEGEMVKISVCDEGIGIREEDIGKLFKEFQQIDSGTSRKYGGTGLGLAITKKLAELHGGKIMVESKYGEGSTFTFLLPLKKMNAGG